MAPSFMTSALSSNVINRRSSMKMFSVEITDFDNDTEYLEIEAKNAEQAAEKARDIFSGDIYMMNIYAY